MIGFIDVALGAFLRQELGSKYTVAMAPPEIARQSLAKKVAHAHRGIPGVSYWRTSVGQGELHNLAQASHPGVQQGVIGSTYHFTRQIDRTVEYTIVARTRYTSDRDALERAFAFMGIYRVVIATITDANNQEYSIKFPINTQPVIYEYEHNSDAADSNWYGFITKITTNAPWVRGANTPRIESVFVNYHEFVSGKPIEDPLLETITITTDPPGDPDGEITVTGEP